MLGVFAIVCCILFFVHRSGQKRYKRMLAQSEEDGPAASGGAEPDSGVSGAPAAGGSDR